MDADQQCLLFRRWPRLRATLPWLPLARLPTPLERLDPSGLGLDCAELLVKRDDQSGDAYGGNKVRKLEFLLATARTQQASGVITFGVAGSNHALATSIYARQCGLASYSLLTRQSNASYTRSNLLAGLHAGAHLLACDSESAAADLGRILVAEAGRRGETLCVIPGGGSSPIGCMGFVNAGFELATQLETDGIPAPDLIYLALGTVGTAAGLQLGLRLSGLATRIVAVRVVREEIGNAARFQRLYAGTLKKLAQAAGQPLPAVDGDELPIIRHEFIGPGYARFTPAGMAAIEEASTLLDIRLDPTYTGKAFSALLADLRAGRLTGQRVLFWDTYSSRPLDPGALAADYHALPEPFHYYFEQPVQPLDPAAGERQSVTHGTN